MKQADTVEVLLFVKAKTVKLKPSKKRPANRKEKVIHDQEAFDRLLKIWVFFWYKYGKYLPPFIRDTIDFLKATSKDPDFNLTDTIDHHKPGTD